MSMSRVDLSGHVAIVTGANHGIGAAIARTLAGSGAAVLLSYLRLKMKRRPGPQMPTDERGPADPMR